MSSTCTCIVFLSNTFITRIASLYYHIKREWIGILHFHFAVITWNDVGYLSTTLVIWPLLTVRTHNVIIMCSLGENDVATSFFLTMPLSWSRVSAPYVFKCSFHCFTALQLCNQQQERCVLPGCDVWEYRILLVGGHQESHTGQNAIRVDHSWWFNAGHKEDQKPTSSW